MSITFVQETIYSENGMHYNCVSVTYKYINIIKISNSNYLDIGYF